MERTRAAKLKIDYPLLVAVLALVIVGLVMVYSAGIVVSHQNFGDDYFYLRHQVYSLVVGLAFLVVGLRIKYTTLEKLAPYLFFATFLALILVFIPGIGFSYGGASRWIHVGPIFVQPTEILKVTFILYLASWLSKKGEGLRSFSYGFLPFLIMTGIIMFLIIKQPDMGTMITIGITAFVIFFVAGANLTHLLAAGGAGIALLVILIKATPYRMSRVIAFLDPDRDLQGVGYHINQAILAIGTGGLLGLGFGQSVQKYNYLPEVTGDSIFAVAAEELGFLRMVLVMALYVFLAYRGFRIAKYAPDVFTRLVATGITAWITFQAAINIGAMVAVFPLTGIPLPFVSYGGSSLVALLAAVGVLLNISRHKIRE